MPIKRFPCGILVALQLSATCITVAQTGTGRGISRPPAIFLANHNQANLPRHDRTKPAIAVSTRILDFGSVPVGSTNQLSFTVQNAGAGFLTGTANVSAPFNIVGGSAYVLAHPQTRSITVQYVPKTIGMHMTVLHLTGTERATITVMGYAAPLPTAPARRSRTPTQPSGLRLIAGS